MKMNFKKFALLFLLIYVACKNGDNSNPPPTGDDPIEAAGTGLVNAFPNLTFNRPVDLQSPLDGTDRLFVVEQPGIVYVFPNEPDIEEASVFLDIQNIVDDSEDEMGLLGLAFHPNFETNGYFYVNYSASSRLSVISRFQVSSSNTDLADTGSELILLEIPQPFTNHNGGQLAFGPDGFLYIATGDGGSGGDPQGNAQNRTNLLGAILRIDVDNTENGRNYAIPNGNPNSGHADFRNEIFAYGLRNPWRMSFDTATGLLWTGDVGQNAIEEINVIENGNNYGWNILEGTDCFGADTCDRTGLTPPVFEYSQGNGDRSVTGGYVYRGEGVLQLQGRYVYGDFISGRIWALTTNLGSTLMNDLLMDTDLNIASFGTDANNELYICSFDGSIYRFEEN